MSDKIPIIIHCPTLKVWLKPNSELKERLKTVMENIERTNGVFGDNCAIDCIKLLVGSEVDKIECYFEGSKMGELPSSAETLKPKGDTGWRNIPLEHPFFKGHSVSTIDRDILSYAMASMPWQLSQNDKDKIQAFLNTSVTPAPTGTTLDDDEIPF